VKAIGLLPESQMMTKAVENNFMTSWMKFSRSHKKGIFFLMTRISCLFSHNFHIDSQFSSINRLNFQSNPLFHQIFSLENCFNKFYFQLKFSFVKKSQQFYPTRTAQLRTSLTTERIVCVNNLARDFLASREHA
jgi:hypothetical protein